MRIGIDARALAEPRTGVGKYLESLLNGLAELPCRHDLILYTPQPVNYRLPDGRWSWRVDSGPWGHHQLLWLHLYLGSLIKRDRLDLFWSPNVLLPLTLPDDPMSLISVHDLVQYVAPSTMTLRNFAATRLFSSQSIRRANHVIVNSDATGADLERYLGTPRSKMTVIYPAISSSFYPRDPDEAQRWVATRFGLPARFFLTVGTLEPRKNLAFAIRTYMRLPLPIRRAVPFVVVGSPGWEGRGWYRAGFPGHDDTVRLLGYVSDSDLPWIYAAARVFLFPSLYEGFGIPIVEAMACGIPTIASDIPASREVALDAAVFVPLGDEQRWMNAMMQLLEDENLGAVLKTRGTQRARAFSCRRSARKLLNLIEVLRED